MWYVDDEKFKHSDRLQYTGHNNKEILDWSRKHHLDNVYELFNSVRVDNDNESIILQETEYLAVDPEGYAAVLVRSEKEFML